MSELKHEFTWKLPARPARVFAALTDANELKQWFAEHAEVEPLLGGAYRFWGKHTYGAPKRDEAAQRITKFAPSQALAYSWRIHDRDSTVSFVIESDPENADGAIVKGSHIFDEAPSINRAKEMVDDHWRFNWGNLSAHISGGQGIMLVDYSAAKPEVALSIYIDAPPSAVFRSLIDPERIQQWFGVAAAVDPRTGGNWHLQMEVQVDGKKVATPPCRILDFEQDKRLSISWPDWRGDKTVPDQRVTWLLKQEGEGTRVDFLHDGFIRAVDVSDYPFGWGYFLSRIDTVSQGKALEPPPSEHQC